MINGETVLEYTKPQVGGGVVEGFDPKFKIEGTLPKEGFIALQSEGQPIDFRNIRIRNLAGSKDPKAKNYKDYFIAEKSQSFLY